MDTEKRIVLSGEFEDVLQFNDHYYIRSKFDRVCIVPYTTSDDGLLDKMGIVEVWNEEERETSLTLPTGYLNQDDGTNLVGANRILYEITGTNLTDASRWMPLGAVFNSLTSDSPIRIYAVDITGIEIQEDVMDKEAQNHFKLMDSSRVVQTDDLLFLGAFTRLFNFFYTNSLR